MEIMPLWFPFYKVPLRPHGIIWSLGIKTFGKAEASAKAGLV